MEWRIGEFQKYKNFIRDTERRFGIPSDMLAIICYQASRYDKEHIAGKGRNPEGVIGIANLTKADALSLWKGIDQRTDPLASIAGAARILRNQYMWFNDWKLALAAYHATAEKVRNHLHKYERLPIDARQYVEQVAAHCAL